MNHHLSVSELCKCGVIHKWHRNLRRYLDAAIPPFTVFSHDLRCNLRFLPSYTDLNAKRHDGVNGNVHITGQFTS